MRTTASVPLAIVVVVLVSAFAATIPTTLASSSRHAVSGTVVSDAGQPLEGVQVNGYVYTDNTSGNDQATTDVDGTFTLSLPEGKGNVNAYYPKWGASASTEIAVFQNVTGLKLTLTAPPPKTATIEGRILGIDGKPIENANVRLSQGCCVMYEKPTPAGDTGTAPPPDATPMTTSEPASSGNETTMSAIARPAYCCNNPEPLVTGPDGTYRFESYGGPMTISADAKGYATSSTNVQAIDGQTVHADLTLEKVPPADATLHGRILDAATGLPVAGASVSLYNVEWGRSNWTTTGADGSYTFTTLPGWTQISASADARNPQPVPMDAVSSDMKIRAPEPGAEKSYYQYQHTLAIKSGNTPLDIKLQPKPTPTTALIGYVVDPTSKTGVPGASITVWNQDAGEWGQAQTDKTGSYRILVRPGHYTISAYAEGYLGGSESFALPEGQPTHRQDVQILKGNTKYAPCDEGCTGGPIYYAKGEAGTPTAAPTSAMSATPGAPTTTEARSADNAAANAPPQNPTGAQAYSGTGGGLPAYNADAAGTPETQPTKTVPAVGMLVGIGVMGAIALAMRRRS